MHQSDLSPYDPPLWNYPTRNQNVADGYQRNQSSDDKAGDLAYYNEFLKNNIDFSESNESFTNRREEGYFNLSRPMRDDFDLMETNFSRKFNDMFRPDFDLQSDIFSENKVSLPEKIAENLDSLEYNAQATIPERKSVNSNLDYAGAGGDQFGEFPYGQPGAMSQNYTQFGNPLAEKVNGTEQQYKTMLEAQSTIKHLQEPEHTIMVNNSMASITNKLSLAHIHSHTQNDQQSFPLSTIKINLNHPFTVQRKISLPEMHPVKAMSQPSSVESPESVKKWTEVSMNLHNDTVQSATISEKQTTKRTGKKKLKTSPPENTELKPNTSQQMIPEYSGIARTESRISVGDNNMKPDDNFRVSSTRSENMEYRFQMATANMSSDVNFTPSVSKAPLMNNSQMNRNMMPMPPIQQGINNYPGPIGANTVGQNGNYARPPIKMMMTNNQQFGYNAPSNSVQYHENPEIHHQEFGNQRPLPYEKPINMNEPHETMRTNNLNFNQTFKPQSSEPQPYQFKANGQGSYNQASENYLRESQGRNLLNMIKESPLKQQQYQQQPRQQLQPGTQQEQAQYQQSQQSQQQPLPQRQQQYYPQQPFQPNQQPYPQNPQLLRQQHPDSQQPRQNVQQMLPQQQYPQQQYPQQHSLDQSQNYQRTQDYHQQVPLPQQQQQFSQTQYSQQNQPRQFPQQQKQYPQQMPLYPQNQQQQYPHYQQSFNGNQSQRYNTQLPTQQQQQPQTNGYQMPQQASQMQLMSKEITPNQKMPQVYPNQRPPTTLPPQQVQQPQQFHLNQPINSNQQMPRQPPLQQPSQYQPSQIPRQTLVNQKEIPQNQSYANPINSNFVKQPPQVNETAPSMPKVPHDPKMLNQAAATFFSKNDPKDLFNNLQIPEEVQKTIMKSNFLEKIQNIHTRKIGTLTIQERKIKVEKYLEKRKQKSWDRKVNYQSRKKVAEKRPRDKGRFVTKENLSAGVEREAEPRESPSNEMANQIENRYLNNYDEMNPDFDEISKSPFKDFNQDFEKEAMFSEFDFGISNIFN